MRALGPGSVSSLLKIVLDVVYGLMLFAVGVLVIAAIAALLFKIDPALVKQMSINGLPAERLTQGPVIALLLTVVGLYVGGVTVVIHRLRQIFTTLTAGDPFHPDNVMRLRLIGLMLVALELTGYAISAGQVWLFPGSPKEETVFSLSSWFSILVVFVLAEVFREGARLRREAELTI
jgi:Protein of unknown function (DUF2975)